MSWLWVLAGIAVLGLMVLVHEWGHFIVAKLFGVRVKVFSIGFGPRLFGRKRGHTDYRLSLIPLGGYVSMAGDNPLSEREGAPYEFLSKPRWQRALIALAGPTINILMAVLLLFVLFQYSFEQREYADKPAEVHYVLADTPASAAGVQAGDLIVRIGEAERPTWNEVEIETALNGRNTLPVTLLRDGERLEIKIQPRLVGVHDIPFVGWLPFSPLVINAVEPGMPAARAGLEVGDEIVAVNGVPTTETGQQGFVDRIQGSEGSPVLLKVRRGEETFEKEIAPEERLWGERKAYYIGVGIGPRTVSVRLGPVEAFRESVAQNVNNTDLLFRLLRRLVVGQADLNTVQGPIGITMISGQAAQLGWVPLLNLMAMISINLGILNLLPIPILDGGHITLFAIEGALGRDVSLRAKERIIQVGFVLLVTLFVVVMYNDVMRYFFR